MLIDNRNSTMKHAQGDTATFITSFGEEARLLDDKEALPRYTGGHKTCAKVYALEAAVPSSREKRHEPVREKEKVPARESLDSLGKLTDDIDVAEIVLADA